MRKAIRLFIDNSEADTGENPGNLALSYSIESLEPGKVQGAYSKRSVKLPPTTTNRRLFESIEIPANDAPDAVKLLPARVEVNGIPVLSGKAQLSTVQLSGLRPSTYEVALYGANADWFKDVGEQLVRNLGFVDIVLTEANVETYGAATPGTDDYCFIVLKWQDWERDTEIMHREHTPALFLNAILKKAFSAKGYTLTSIFDQDPFNRLVIPVALNLDGEYLQGFVNVTTSVVDFGWSNFAQSPPYQVTVVFDDDTTTPNSDGGNNYNTTTGVYTAPIDADYFINITGEMTLLGLIPATLGGSYAVNFVTVLNGVIIAESASSIPLFGVIDYEYALALTAGDQVRIDIYMTQATGIDGDILTVEFDATLTIEAEKENWNLGDDIEWEYVVPGTWVVKDIIKDISKIFNLAWETDVQAGTVFAWPRDPFQIEYRVDGSGAGTAVNLEGFYNTTGQSDVSQKVNLIGSSKLDIIDGYDQDLVLAWATDDPTTEASEELQAVNLYSARYRFPDGRFRAGSKWDYTNFFAKTIHLADTDISSATNAAPCQIPLVYGDDYNKTTDAKPDYNLAPKLLYFAGRRSGIDGYMRLYGETSSATSAYDYPAAWQVNYNDPSAIDWSLSFADETTNAGGTVKGLFKTLHARAAKRIEVGKLYELPVYWDEKDLSELSFRNRVLYDNSNFILQEINGYIPGTNGATPTRLLLDWGVSTGDALNIAGPIGLEGSTPGGGTVVGSGSGFIGSAPTVQIIRYRKLFADHTSTTLTLDTSSGLLSVVNTSVSVMVTQNGQKQYEGEGYTITGLNIDISAIHYDGATYEVIIFDVIK